jgi:hypothetical protein
MIRDETAHIPTVLGGILDNAGTYKYPAKACHEEYGFNMPLQPSVH